MRSKTVTESEPHSGAWQKRHCGGSRNNNSGKGVWMSKEQNISNNVSTAHDASRSFIFNMINNRGRRGSGNSQLDISGDGSNINEGGGRGSGGNIVGGVDEGGHRGSDNSIIHKGGNGGNFDGGGRRGHGGNMVGGAGEGGRRGSDNSNIHMGGNGGNFDRSGRRCHGRDIVSSVGEGGGRGTGNKNIHIAGNGSNINGHGRRRCGSNIIHSGSGSRNSDFDTNGDSRNIDCGGGRGGCRVNINSSAIGEGGRRGSRDIQIDIGGDDLNMSTSRGRRGRGGNSGRGGGGIRSRSSDIDGGDRGSHRGGGSTINGGSKYQPRASLDDVVQKYVLPAVLTLLQVTNLFNTEAAYMWTSFAAFLVYCALLILNNDTVLIGHLKLVFGSMALVASLSIVIPSKLRHFALIIWAILVILIIARPMLKKSYQWIHCAAKQIIRRMMCMVQRPEQAQSQGLPV
ncbi:hypothetical protein Ancab_014373 [Ancistrocladus abbreviatus]